MPEKANVKAPGRWWRPVLLLAMIVTLVVIAKVFHLGGKLGAVQDWIRTLGVWGPIVFITIYALATIVAVPGSALTIGAGALFGSVQGVIFVSIASTLGASLCFLIARYVARNAVAGWLAKNEKFSRLDALTERHGAIIVAITRLVPIFPFNLLNYGFGLTRVRLRTYVLWSWLCMLPGTVLYVVGADAVATALSDGKVPWLLVLVIIIVMAFLAVVVKKAKGKLED